MQKNIISGEANGDDRAEGQGNPGGSGRFSEKNEHNLTSKSGQFGRKERSEGFGIKNTGGSTGRPDNSGKENVHSRFGQSAKSVTIRVSVVSVITNIILSLFKLFAGIFGHSGAMIADAIHSFSDVAGSMLVIFGAHLAGKASDKDHQYGHERLECIISAALANILLLIGVGIGIDAIRGIMNPQEAVIPGGLALAAAVISIVAKEILFWYTRAAAAKIDSVSLRAEAWHHRSDAVSSVGSFIGILGAILGYPLLQPAACVFIAVLIIRAGIAVFRETIDKLVDKSCDAKTTALIRDAILSQEGVLGLDEMKTRMFGSKVYVDIEIACDGTQSLYDAHKIAEAVHHRVENLFPGRIKHCSVHVNPR